jgi:hypothetical protein
VWQDQSAIREYPLPGAPTVDGAVTLLAPIGDTTALSLTWDGWDLVRTLSRRVTVRGCKKLRKN